MALKYAPFCSRCNTHRTLHPSGICSRCRKRPNPRSTCILCGCAETNHDSGVCYHCRKKSPHQHDLDDIIARYKRIVTVLELRKANRSYSEIAHTIGLSKTATYEIYRSALHLPSWCNPDE